MALSDNAAKRIFHAVGDQVAGREIVDAVNQGQAGAASEAWSTVGVIIAQSTSSTTDFGSLQVGDRVVMIPAVAGNSVSLLVATAGTLPVAAVTGNTYMVLRAFALPAASTQKL